MFLSRPVGLSVSRLWQMFRGAGQSSIYVHTETRQRGKTWLSLAVGREGCAAGKLRHGAQARSVKGHARAGKPLLSALVC
jgi:hypothetical protein